MIFARCMMSPFSFFFNDTATTEIYTLSLHDALPICVTHATRLDKRVKTFGKAANRVCKAAERLGKAATRPGKARSEEHTSELQSPCNLVCRLLLEKKKECGSKPNLVMMIKALQFSLL